jgi:outer membrane protein OmpA-like peptidoglycan-associated protein
MALSACATAPPKPPPAVQAKATPCAEIDLPVYFPDGSAELTAPARAAVADAGRQAAKCTTAEVEVVGLADYRGPADANLELSRKRAQTVAQALEKAGLPAPRFALVAAGQAGAVTAAGLAVPMERKTEVRIRFAAAR